jgi:hypothetical protein
MQAVTPEVVNDHDAQTLKKGSSKRNAKWVVVVEIKSKVQRKGNKEAPNPVNSVSYSSHVSLNC